MSISQGWDDAPDATGSRRGTKYGPNMHLGYGTISASQTRIRGLAGDYGINLSNQTSYDWASKIADGLSTEQSFAEYAKTRRNSRHPYCRTS